MSFITLEEAEQNVEGFSALSERDKALIMKKSAAYLIARNVRPYKDVNDVPEPLKDASYEIIKGIMTGVLYVDKGQAIKRKSVDADGVKSDKEFQDGSVAVSAIEQFIDDLIKPYITMNNIMFIRKI